MTVGDALRASTLRLAPVGDGAPHDASLLLGHVLGRDRAWLMAHRDDPIDPAARGRNDALVRRRASGEPLAYVLGEAWFFGRRFEVDGAVLVPRPETELLVEAALSEITARRRRGASLVRACDVGTGSGAIAVTLALEDAALRVTASDVSAAALAVAQRNADAAGVGARIRFVAGDLAEPLVPLRPFDVIVANLPYVPTSDIPPAPDAVGFEPRVAVDGGADGLVLYRRLTAALPALAAPGACAFFEAAPGTIEPLAALVAAVPGAHVEIGEDYAGLERWVAVTLP